MKSEELSSQLFELLAAFSVPLERTFHKALEAVKSDTEISEKYREELLTSIKALLFNSLELHGYVAKKDTSLAFDKGGKNRYSKIRSEYIKHFPLSEEEFNLHEYIEIGQKMLLRKKSPNVPSDIKFSFHKLL